MWSRVPEKGGRFDWHRILIMVDVKQYAVLKMVSRMASRL